MTMDSQWKQREAHHGSIGTHATRIYEDKSAFAVNKGSGDWFIFSYSCRCFGATEAPSQMPRAGASTLANWLEDSP